MSHKIGEIKDLDTEIQAKLIAAGITTVEHLLEQSATPAARATLAKQLEVSGSQLTDAAICCSCTSPSASGC